MLNISFEAQEGVITGYHVDMFKTNRISIIDSCTHEYTCLIHENPETCLPYSICLDYSILNALTLHCYIFQAILTPVFGVKHVLYVVLGITYDPKMVNMRSCRDVTVIVDLLSIHI